MPYMNNFFKKVYEIVGKIPSGKVATYGQIASMLGSSKSARTVGWAMSSAPENLKLPCHRVVNRVGELANENVFGSRDKQRAMLESEGVTFNEKGFINLEKHLWKP